MSVFCWWRCGFVGEVEGKKVEVCFVELMPPGGNGVGAGHEAGIEVADEDFGTFAACYVVGLFAVWHGGEVRVERRVGLVDLGEDANAGQARPVGVVHAGEGADAGDGVARADTQGVESVSRWKDIVVVPSGR